MRQQPHRLKIWRKVQDTSLSHAHNHFWYHTPWPLRIPWVPHFSDHPVFAIHLLLRTTSLQIQIQVPAGLPYELQHLQRHMSCLCGIGDLCNKCVLILHRILFLHGNILSAADLLLLQEAAHLYFRSNLLCWDFPHTMQYTLQHSCWTCFYSERHLYSANFRGDWLILIHPSQPKPCLDHYEFLPQTSHDPVDLVLPWKYCVPYEVLLYLPEHMYHLL